MDGKFEGVGNGETPVFDVDEHHDESQKSSQTNTSFVRVAHNLGFFSRKILGRQFIAKPAHKSTGDKQNQLKSSYSTVKPKFHAQKEHT